VLGSSTVLAVIPARGGSRRLPGKHLLALGGRPLLAWTLDAARGSRLLDRAVLSTEDPRLADAARALGAEVPFLRPAELATDHASSICVVEHALAALEQRYDWIVLLQPTSPLRDARDIDACLRLVHEAGANACVSVSEPDRSPYLCYRLDGAGRLQPLLARAHAHMRTQDLPPAVAPNGAIYVARVPWFLEHRSFLAPETLAYLMPRERSCDIDSALDLRIADALLPR
jgi:N-acylneuraminate cytidylyltransferase